MRTKEEIEAMANIYGDAYDECATSRNAAIYDALNWVLGEDLALEPDK